MRKIRQKIFLLLVIAMVVSIGVLATACENTVTITFDTNGGSAVDSITGKVGAAIKLPADPTRDGYFFGGWYLDKDCIGERQQLPAVMPSKDITYYAKWTAVETATLTLVCQGGTIAQSVHEVAVGSNLSQYLATVTVTPDDGLEFAGWYKDSGVAITETSIMPYNGLTLTAKFNVEYTLRVYKQNLDGSYPQEPEIQQLKAFYGEAFNAYSNAVEHFSVDNSKNNRINSVSLTKNETFTVYLKRNTYSVTFLPNFASSFDWVVNVPYETVISVIEAPSRDGYRFAAWATSATEEDGCAYYAVDDQLTVDGNVVLYAQWDKGYTDVFGGSDLIFIPHLETQGTAILYRVGLGEITGQYDTATSIFSFGDGLLTGKIVDNVFYYYKDSIERTYSDHDGGDATLTILPKGVAEYTNGDQKIRGTYDVDPIGGFYLFNSESLNFGFRLDVSGNGVLTFHKQWNKAGYYFPAGIDFADSQTGDGVLMYYLDGFGGAREIYRQEKPYEDVYTGDLLTEIPATYTVVGKNDEFTTYSFVSEYNGNTVHSFDFKIDEGDTGIVGVYGWLVRGDGLTGTYHPNRYDYLPTSGEVLYLDGFGSGLYGATKIEYTAHAELFLYYDYDNESIGSLYDFWVEFTLPSENSAKYVRLLYFDDVEDYDYAWIQYDKYLFGKYEVSGGIDVDGERYNALIYSYAGMCQATGYDYYAVMLVELLVEEDTTIWLIYDEYASNYFEFKPTDGVYTMTYGTQFVINEQGYAELFDEEAKPDVIVFFDDEEGKLEIKEDGKAYFTPKNGEIEQVSYTVEEGYGYYLISLFTFENINGKTRIFAYHEDYDYSSYSWVRIATEVEGLYINKDDSSLRLVVYGQGYYGAYAAFGILLDGKYYYGVEGTFEEVDNGQFVFSYSNGDRYANFPSYCYDDVLVLVDGELFDVLIPVGNKVELHNGDETLYFDGFGNAVFTKNGQSVDYQYDIYFGYQEYGAEVAIIYVLIASDNSYVLVKVDEQNNTFKYVGKEAGLYDDLQSQYQFFYGSASTYFYVFLDGDGIAYYFETTGYALSIFEGVYEATGNEDEYLLSVNYEDGQILRFYILTMPDDGIYFPKDESQEGEFDVANGGKLKGDGYGYYEGLGFLGLATYTDAAGKVYQGLMQIGVLNDKTYGERYFVPATNSNERQTVQFSVLRATRDGYEVVDVLYFDIYTGGVAHMRIGEFGAYRLVSDGKSTKSSMYLDGHGNATLYDGGGNVVGEGQYVSDWELGDSVYRLSGKNGETIFLFTLYARKNVGGNNGHTYEYAVYNPQQAGILVSSDWAYLKLDGYAWAVYVDKYGVAQYGTYGYCSDWLIAFYPDDLSNTIYLQLTQDGFEVAEFTNGFIIDSGILYAYNGVDSNVTIPEDVVRIAKHAFASTAVTSVVFNNVQIVDEEAFLYTKLTTVYSENIVTVGKRAFAQIENLTTVYLPGAKSIGEEAFFGSRVTSMTLAAVAEIGDRAFSHSYITSVMTLDLTTVESVASIKWGKDVFTCSLDDTLDYGNVIGVHVVVGDIQAVNALYVNEALSVIKDSIGFKSGNECIQYYSFADGNIYQLSNGLFQRMEEGVWELERGNTIGLYQIDDGKVFIYSLRTDGSGYDFVGSEAGTTDGFAVNGSVYLALYQEVELQTTDGQCVVLTLNINYEGFFEYTYDITISLNETEYIGRFDFDGVSILFTQRDSDLTLLLLVQSATTCKVETIGRIPVLLTDELVPWQITFLIDLEGNVSVRYVEYRLDDGSFTAPNVVSITQESDYIFIFKTGSEDTPFVYRITYIPANGATMEGVVVEYVGSIVFANMISGNNHSVVGSGYLLVYAPADTRAGQQVAIVNVESYVANGHAYVIVDAQAQLDGSIILQVKYDENSAEIVTYKLTAQYLGRTNYLVTVTEITD